MRANILFQYKRPEYISVSHGKEWNHWKQPYYRYDIYPKQQNLLDQISKSFNDKILIVYASPAAWKMGELIDLKVNKKIIDTSNFKRASVLQGHERNTYIESGTYSIACSEPVRFENLNLLAELEELENNEINERDDNQQFVVRFANRVSSIVREDQNYSDSFIKLIEDYSSFYQYELLYSFLTVSVFKQLTGTQWIVKL